MWNSAAAQAPGRAAAVRASHMISGWLEVWLGVFDNFSSGRYCISFCVTVAVRLRYPVLSTDMGPPLASEAGPARDTATQWNARRQNVPQQFEMLDVRM